MSNCCVSFKNCFTGCTRRSECDLVDATIDYDPRMNLPFMGTLGIISSAYATGMSVWFITMVLGLADRNVKTINWAMIVYAAVHVIAYGINILFFGPKMAKDPITGLLLYERNSSLWAVKYAREKQFTNDQGNLGTQTFSAIALVAFYSIYILAWGEGVMDSLPQVYDAEATYLSILSTTFLGIGALLYGACWPLYILETQSDQDWRQWTAVNESAEITGKELPIGSNINANSGSVVDPYTTGGGVFNRRSRV